MEQPPVDGVILRRHLAEEPARRQPPERDVRCVQMGVVAAQPGPGYGVALLDLSTGEFTATEYLGPDARQTLADEIAVLRPREIVTPAGLEDVGAVMNELGLAALVTNADDWTFEYESARRALLEFDFAACEQFADRMDPRLQKISLRGSCS